MGRSASDHPAHHLGGPGRQHAGQALEALRRPCRIDGEPAQRDQGGKRRENGEQGVERHRRRFAQQALVEHAPAATTQYLLPARRGDMRGGRRALPDARMRLGAGFRRQGARLQAAGCFVHGRGHSGLERGKGRTIAIPRKNFARAARSARGCRLAAAAMAANQAVTGWGRLGKRAPSGVGIHS